MINEVRIAALSNERRIFVQVELRQSKRLIVGPLEG
jgi:hypothetical protein